MECSVPRRFGATSKRHGDLIDFATVPEALQPSQDLRPFFQSFISLGLIYGSTYGTFGSEAQDQLPCTTLTRHNT